MSLKSGYGRFAAAVNSLLIAILCVTVAHAQTAPVNSDPVKLAFLGDSLAAGYGVSPAQSIPARLEAALKKEGRPRHHRQSRRVGRHTAGGLGRIDWMLADKPDIVIVELGANDALRATDPVSTERNLDAIIAG